MSARARVAAIGCLAALIAGRHAQGEVLAFWNFGDGPDTGDYSETVKVNNTVGTPQIFIQKADKDANGKGGTSYMSSDSGVLYDATRAAGWDDFAKSGGDNDGEIIIALNTTGFTDLFIRFDLRAESVDDLFNRLDFDYSLSPLDDENGTMDFQGGTAVDIANNLNVNLVNNVWGVFEFDLSGVTALNDQGIVNLRLNDFQGNDELIVDNVEITGLNIVDFILGDMNGDDNLTLADAPLFIQALVDRAKYDLTYSFVNADAAGDVNENGTFDLGDIADFSAMFGGSASADAVPEPATLSLAVILLLGIAIRQRRRG
jgi:hypothetical protein